ncbi:MAG: phage repressor protein/antirepressor Ant [Firmicutes bacterium]|nr:phage repressor protein/antirepressor Ant [Bacillota bacterium]
MNEILNIDGIECYEENGTAYLKLETVARGLGFTQTQNKNGTEYTSVRWERVEQYLEEIGFPHKWGKDDFIPENIFYRLAMKAKNEIAEAFQAKVADEIIPSIRKHGGYIANQENLTPEQIVANALIVAQNIIDEKNKQIEKMQPKAEYFDALVDRNLLTNFRDTAKELGIKEREFIRFLIDKKYVYRDKKDKLKPYADKNDGLFEVKEFVNEKTQFASTQTLITPKGRETFRLLYLKTTA